MFDVEKYGPWAVIAGGSEGVGPEFALLLADVGINSVLIARKPEPLAAAAEAVRAKGVEVRTVSVDLTDPASMDDIIEATKDLDIGFYFHNPGANTYGHEFITGDLEKFQKVVDLNIGATMRLMQYFGKRLADRGRGGILVSGSGAGLSGSAEISVYAAAKAFKSVFTESMWLELRKYNVDVMELVLGVVRTPAMERAGLNFDIPGMVVSDPADVARDAFENFGTSPVKFSDGNEESMSARRSPDRAKVLQQIYEHSLKLLPPRD
ncbi:SDR family NAD(P)-dependent oxidoreductase [Enemella sp. A6]|uniref:SDR family NAD(P)-dependent oxidoreductase n=1 Tax=Enemella sp. A6 TaxID=3440152 RepID=UPI003EC10223